MWSRDQARYVGGFFFLAASIPGQMYLGYKFAKEPVKNRVYLFRGALLSFSSLLFFGYSAYRH